MGRARAYVAGGSVWAVAPWLLALVGALLLTQELSPKDAGSLAVPPAADRPAPEPTHKEEVVFQPWEHVST